MFTFSKPSNGSGGRKWNQILMKGNVTIADKARTREKEMKKCGKGFLVSRKICHLNVLRRWDPIELSESELCLIKKPAREKESHSACCNEMPFYFLLLQINNHDLQGEIPSFFIGRRQKAAKSSSEFRPVHDGKMRRETKNKSGKGRKLCHNLYGLLL